MTAFLISRAEYSDRAQPVAGDGHEHRAADLAEEHGGPDVLGVEGVLDGDFRRPVGPNDLFQLGLDLVQLVVEGKLGAWA